MRVLRDFARIYGPALAIVIIGLFIAYQFVEPAPPRHLVMATGHKGGGYYAYGLQYQQELARLGITLEVRETSGSVENLRLLQDPLSGVDIAFIQGGIVPDDHGERVRALASVFVEPLWLFTKLQEQPDRLSSLKGMRIALGPEGSGTHVMLDKLLQANGVDDGNTTLLPLAGDEALAALHEGSVDVVATVQSAKAPMIQTFAEEPGVRLMSLQRAHAYVQRWPYLRGVTLYEGVLDFQYDIPHRDINLLAPIAALAAHRDFHPALVVAFLGAAQEIHGVGDLFALPRAFPQAEHPEIPTIRGARQYLQHGPSFLQDWLPFWMAVEVDRLIVLMIPLLTLLLPLARILPPAIDWRVRSRAFRWYRELRAIEHDALALQPGDAATRASLAVRLDEIDRRVQAINMPLSRSDLLYNLRQHLELVRTRLGRSGDDPAPAAGAPSG